MKNDKIFCILFGDNNKIINLGVQLILSFIFLFKINFLRLGQLNLVKTKSQRQSNIGMNVLEPKFQ